jgi:hypothetical protein
VSHSRVRNLLGYSERSVAAGKTIGTAAVAGTAIAAVVGAENAASTMLSALPGFAMVQGLFSIINGVLAALNKNAWHNPHQDWAPARNAARGITEMVSGAYLLEGGIEESAKAFFAVDISWGLPGSLYWRFAVYSITQFALAFEELWTFYKVSKQYREHNPEFDRRWEKMMINFVATGLASAGWVCLAWTKDMADIKGCICLVGAALAYGCVYIPRALSFLANKFYSSVDSSSELNGSSHVSQDPERGCTRMKHTRKHISQDPDYDYIRKTPTTNLR